MIADNEVNDAFDKQFKKIPKVYDRNRVVEYLYRHKIGDKLPRGREFNLFRGIENKHWWLDEVKRSNYDIYNSKYSKRISLFLLSQITFLRRATINRKCQLNTEVFFDVVKMLEGDKYSANSTSLLKNNIKFDGCKLFKNYKHSHLSLLPNSYLNFMVKNKKRLINYTDQEDLTLNVEKFESEVSGLNASKEKRMTGHWLITKEVNGESHYLTITPHSRGAIDDFWIFEMVSESERYLLKRGR
ncbi:hypothetical protein [Marinicellulosiphila megalodicopiae]|uniref:hypothetical protein n=1 Tax=Marinicellulosiphila megalodicopiae TaxID=2724896 RepID=UPI003BB08F84